MRWFRNARQAVLFSALLSVFAAATVNAQFYPPPFETREGTIGLTLSGGGAKGLAHIGLLHVIDSLGLKIDYVSGTSMGAIVGGLYASGYSAREIEELALSIDWENIFAARPDLRFVHPRNRRHSGRSVIEVPLDKGRIRIITGAIEGPQLWTTLEELFFHVRNVNDFAEFGIPFACVATDIETGEAIVLKDGDIVSAIRASMAIPVVFSAVDRDGRKLVDGGAVNNFPVDVVKAMGAEYTIGMFVSDGLRPAEKLRTPLDIIYQIGLFKAAHMHAINRELTDMFIQPDLEEYSTFSFADAAAIIQQGKQTARSYIEDLRVIAANNPRELPADAGPAEQRISMVVADTLIINGLSRVRHDFVINRLHIQQGDTVTVPAINQAIRRLYATDYFDRITYTYEPQPDQPGHCKLIFTMLEKPLSSLHTALHYSSFSGVGIIAGIRSNKFLLYNLNAGITGRLSEQPAFRAGLDFYASDRQRSWISLEASGEVINFPVYDRFEAIGRYRQSYFRAESVLNRLAGNNAIITAGAASYLQRLVPTMRSDNQVRGSNNGYEAFVAYNIYSLNRHDLPQRGQNLLLKASYFFNQSPEVSVESGSSAPTTLQDIGITIGNFLQLKFNWESYVPVHSNMTMFTQLQGGYNYNYTQGFLNMFNLGGTYPFLRDQIVFAGLREYEVMSASVVSAAIGWHINFWSDIYLTPLFNAAVYDFDKHAKAFSLPENLLMGVGLSFGYLSPLGPLSTTIAYSPQSNRVVAYVNLGWAF